MSQITPMKSVGSVAPLSPVLHPSKNSLPEEVRAKVTRVLGARMVDAIDLTMMAKQAHWNVKGPQFSALHALFDEVHDTARQAMDLIAERAVMLGAQVHGTVRAAARLSSLEEYPLDMARDTEHVVALSDRLSAFGKLVRDAIDETDALGDADTADMFTEISRAIDMKAWMVDSHAQRP